MDQQILLQIYIFIYFYTYDSCIELYTLLYLKLEAI